MRSPWLIFALLALPSVAQASSDPVDYASATNECQVLTLVPLTPPSACPNVAQGGVAAGGSCAADRCFARLDGAAQGQGLLPAGPRLLVLEAQAEDFSEPALVLCSQAGTTQDLSCQGGADLGLRVPVGSCASFRVRVTLSDAGNGSSWVYHLVASNALRLCRDSADAAHTERN
jgi:hypothetical protein